MSDETALAVQTGQMDIPLPTDMRAMMMSLDPARQVVEWGKYLDSRNAFRDKLRSLLREGLHYGYPPGLAPKFDAAGSMVVSSWDKKANNGAGAYKTTIIPPSSWVAKPSLYKAGADFICDLLAVRDQYEADMGGWQQLGSPKGVFVYACRLYSRSNGDLVGEGRGCRSVGQKGGDENNAVKMAKKSAKVDAVLNAFGLSDLFTQDLEELKPEPHENPEQRPDAPKPKTREERKATPVDPPAVSRDKIAAEWAEWARAFNDGVKDWELFIKWCVKKAVDRGTPVPYGAELPSKWTKEFYELVKSELPPQ